MGHIDTWLAFLDWDLDASTNFYISEYPISSKLTDYHYQYLYCIL